MLKVLGSKAFVHIPREKRYMLEERCEIGMLVGFSKNSKAWRIALTRSNSNIEVVERADVVFDEATMAALHGSTAVTDDDLIDLGFSTDSLGENDVHEAEYAEL
jgi:hypothetical protein